MLTIEENKKLIEKYPFLLPRNRWTDEVSEDYDYSYTEMDAMPGGWRIAFGDAMLEELAAALGDYAKEYRITQIKEKYGGLRWYDNGAPTHCGHYGVINKYESMSYHICIECGAAATKVSTGWISPYCDTCATKLENWENFKPIDKFYSTEEDDEDAEDIILGSIFIDEILK